MAKLFTTTVYPALTFYLGEKKFKFAGGRLVVADEDFVAVQNFAASRPEYDIKLADADFTEPEPERPPTLDKDAQRAMTPQSLEEAGLAPALDAPEAQPESALDAFEDDEDAEGEDAEGEDDDDEAPEDDEDAEADAEAEASWDAMRADLRGLSNDLLRQRLAAIDQPTSGNKEEMVERLIAAYAELARAADEQEPSA